MSLSNLYSIRRNVYLLSLLGIIIVMNSCKKNEFTIKGKVEGIPDQEIYLVSDEFGNNKTLTAQLQNGEFKFTGKIDNSPKEFTIDFEKKMQSPPNTSLYQFAYDGNTSVIVDENDNIDLYIKVSEDQSKVSIALGAEEYSQRPIVLEMDVKGSKLQDEHNKVKQYINSEFNNRKRVLYGTLYSLPEEDMDSDKGKDLQSQIDKISEEVNVYCKKYISENPNSIVAFKLLQEIKSSPEERERIFNTLSPKVKNSHIALLSKFYEDKFKKEDAAIEMAKQAVAIGKPYIDFKARDTKGNEVTFSSLINTEKKYILLDFWASWCAPCRKENPNLLKAYEKFKSKGFDIVALSVDEGEKEWLKAVKDDKLPWTQLLDEKAFAGIAKQYAVVGIPDNFLIDVKTGTIITRNLRGEDLQKKLDELSK